MSTLAPAVVGAPRNPAGILPGRARVALVLRRVATCVLAGLVTGLVFGLAAPLLAGVLERVAGPNGVAQLAAQGNLVGTFATAPRAVLLPAVVVGLGLGLLLALLEPWIDRNGRLSVLAFAVTTWALAGSEAMRGGLDAPPLDVSAFFGVVSGSLVPLAFGFATALLARRLDALIPPARDDDQVLATVGGVLGLLAVPGLLLLLAHLVSTARCGCEAPVGAGWAMVLLAVLTLAVWTRWVGGHTRDKLWESLRSFGVVVFAFAALFGLAWTLKAAVSLL